MYKVIALKPKRKNYQVIIKDKSDKTSEYTVSEDLIVEFRLVNGKELSDLDFSAFKAAADKDAIYQKLLYYATYKPRTEKEIREYLEKKQILDEDQKYFINKLRKVSIVDDDKYANNYIYEAFNYKLHGLRKIRRDLNLKGIGNYLIDGHIDKIRHEDIIKNIETLFFKKIPEYRKFSSKKAVANIKRFLVSKGYEFSDIEYIINDNFDKIKSSINEADNLKKDFAAVAKEYARKQPKQDRFTFIVRKLLSKGYEYQAIKALIERSK